MNPADYRSDKMESREGRGLALERRRRWEEGIPADVRRAVGHSGATGTPVDRDEDPRLAGFWDEVAKEAKERADLRGFWLAWHLAGGFNALEGAGWNRATLFRKIRRFREVFGEHPDEYRVPWIKLDLEKAWVSELQNDLEGNEPDPAVK